MEEMGEFHDEGHDSQKTCRDRHEERAEGDGREWYRRGDAAERSDHEARDWPCADHLFGDAPEHPPREPRAPMRGERDERAPLARRDIEEGGRRPAACHRRADADSLVD